MVRGSDPIEISKGHTMSQNTFSWVSLISTFLCFQEKSLQMKKIMIHTKKWQLHKNNYECALRNYVTPLWIKAVEFMAKVFPLNDSIK
jgi:hypothetical protein